jgi:hypothetical protein
MYLYCLYLTMQEQWLQVAAEHAFLHSITSSSVHLHQHFLFFLNFSKDLF